MKILKFHHQFINPLISNYKVNTWRLFDEKNLSVGDTLILVDRSTQKPFGRAKILSVKETTFRNLTPEDKKGHEEYKDENEMLKIYGDYHKTLLNLDSPLKVITFEILKKYSVIVTTYKESKTLERAIEAILNEKLDDLEILVVGPDQETEKIAKEFTKRFPEVIYLKDEGIGKPAALNLAFKHAGGEILILTDGDVFIKKDSLTKLLKHFNNEKIGAVSGHPVSLNNRNKMLGYWSHFLTNAADFVRRHRIRSGEYIACSGYLYAIRNIIKEIPERTLVDDEIVSQLISAKGYKITYEPEAEVFVKYPDNFVDWLKQKIRATGGYVQKININDQLLAQRKISKMRGFIEEVGGGIKLFFIYPKSLKELWWTKLLYWARLYLWLLIFWRIKIRKKTAWPRVESTKIL